MNENPNVETSKSQNQMILAWLKSGKGITQLEAAQAPILCWRLGARIWDLRNAGHKIKTEKIQVASGKYVARYILVE